ncbi:BatA domain-containing protein, partial [Maricaulis sp.]|uniref:BatA domain-containing protein n=1 Tax=Maricaulis sp. TaxID=1486257 RepID=UPI003A9154BE
MFALGPLSFGAPLALIGLLSLPILWLLLRATPPAPRRAIFPPLRLLFGAPDDAETPQHAPWWLILFRLLIAALIILGLSRPVWTPPAVVDETRPELIVIDNGWAGAANWEDTSREAVRLLDEAERDGRLAALLFTANSGDAAAPLRLDRPDAARRLLATASPMAWGTDRDNAASRVAAARSDGALADAMAVTWLSDGMDSEGSRTLARALSSMGDVRIIEPDNGRAALAMAPPEPTASGLAIELRRVATSLPRTAAITALGNDGRAIARTDLSFDSDRGIARSELSLPLDLRNRIASLRVEGPGSAGAVRLMGDQWRRPRIGLIDAPREDGQPLLSDLHYVESAIAPFSQPVRGTLDELLETESAALVMGDGGRTDHAGIGRIVANGGLGLRWAGPRGAG